MRKGEREPGGPHCGKQFVVYSEGTARLSEGFKEGCELGHTQEALCGGRMGVGSRETRKKLL